MRDGAGSCGFVTGLPVRENPRRFRLVLPYSTVLLHLTGSVLDGGAPFGNSNFRSSCVAKGEGLTWQLQRACYLDFARAVLAAFSL
jgi:hypothetical protein